MGCDFCQHGKEAEPVRITAAFSPHEDGNLQIILDGSWWVYGVASEVWFTYKVLSLLGKYTSQRGLMYSWLPAKGHSLQPIDYCIRLCVQGLVLSTYCRAFKRELWERYSISCSENREQEICPLRPANLGDICFKMSTMCSNFWLTETSTVFWRGMTIMFVLRT